MEDENFDIVISGLNYDESAQEIGAGVTSIFLRTNDLLRSLGVSRCVVIKRVIVETEIVELSERELITFEAVSRWLERNESGRPFSSPMDVRAFFDPSNQLLSRYADPVVCENLEEAAEVVIKTRLHCDF